MLRTISSLMLIALFCTGCDTMAGFGRDVSRLGDKIEQKADRHR